MKTGDPLEDTERNKKIVYDRPNNGYPYDRELCKKYLTLGTTYTIKHSWMWDASTEIELVEFPRIRFNSVMFTF